MSNKNEKLRLSGREIFKFEAAHRTPLIALLTLAAVASLSVLFVLSSGRSLPNLNGQRFVL